MIRIKKQQQQRATEITPKYQGILVKLRKMQTLQRRKERDAKAFAKALGA